ncbi:hypothetical protein Hanom_Chr04g00308431 [Helianthus anomalus]
MAMTTASELGRFSPIFVRLSRIWRYVAGELFLESEGVDMGFGFAESLVWVRWSCKIFALRISSQELHQALRFRKELVALCCLSRPGLAQPPRHRLIGMILCIHFFKSPRVA